MKRKEKILEEGRRVLQVEADALVMAINHLDQSFVDAVDLIHKAISDGGKVVVSGVGKSGIIAQKVSSTLTSTGTMAVFLHPTEALHGDLGLVGPKDVMLLFSHSGSSQEVLTLLPVARELCKSVVAILGNPQGKIAKFCDAVISSSVSMEACPDNLAPTASSTLALALGDAIAMALKKETGFGPEGFARFHPGGQLGKRLSLKVEDLMHKNGDFAVIPPSATIDEVIIALTKYRHSGVCIGEGKTTSGKPKLVGVIVEGDIRRALAKKDRFFTYKAQDIMKSKPITTSPETRAQEALELMENRDGQLSFLPVVDSEGGCVGVLRIHDLVLSGLS